MSTTSSSSANDHADSELVDTSNYKTLPAETTPQQRNSRFGGGTGNMKYSGGSLVVSTPATDRTFSPARPEDTIRGRVNVQGRIFEISEAMFTSSAFINSHLPKLLDGFTPAGQGLLRDSFGIVKAPPHCSAEAFSMLLSHLSGHNPLNHSTFADVCVKYEQLLAEIIAWKLPRTRVCLPVRLWTHNVWSDLSTFYMMKNDEYELLRLRPVAAQIGDEVDPIPILTAEKQSMDDLEVLLIKHDLQFVMRNLNLTEANLKGCWKFEFPAKSNSSPPSKGRVLSVNIIANEQTWSKLILILIDSLHDKVILYSLPKDWRIPQYDDDWNPAKDEYPYCFSRGSKVSVFFSQEHGLDLKYLPKTDDSPERASLGPASAVIGRRGTLAAATGGWFSSSLGAKLAEASSSEWVCYHPELSPTVKYTNTTKINKEQALGHGNLRQMRFFPWGSLAIFSELEPVYAVLLIDETDLSKIYGQRITVHIKNAQGLNPNDLDVSVTSDLSRIYLLICGQLVSQSTTPMTSKIVFELSSSPKGPRVLFSHVDITEGGPMESDLHCLGEHGEFRPSTGLYYQARINQVLCPRFESVKASAVGC